MSRKLLKALNIQKPAYWSKVAKKCLTKACGGKLFLSKYAGHWHAALLKITIREICLISFAFMALFLHNKMVRNELMTITTVEGVETWQLRSCIVHLAKENEISVFINSLNSLFYLHVKLTAFGSWANTINLNYWDSRCFKYVLLLLPTLITF